MAVYAIHVDVGAAFPLTVDRLEDGSAAKVAPADDIEDAVIRRGARRGYEVSAPEFHVVDADGVVAAVVRHPIDGERELAAHWSEHLHTGHDHVRGGIAEALEPARC